MDADEVYEEKLLKELRHFTENNIKADSFAFPRKNYIDGKQTSAYPDRQIRFFKNNKKIRYQGTIHEQPIGWKRIVSTMDLHIIHRKSSERQVSQTKHYESIEKLMKDR